MLTLIYIILIGALVGYIASLLTHTDKQYGFVSNMVIGIIGSFIAGVITSVATGRDLAELGTFTLTSFIWSIIGSILLILVINSVRGRK